MQATGTEAEEEEVAGAEVAGVKVTSITTYPS